MEFDKEKLELLVKNCFSFRSVLQKMGLVPAGGNYRVLCRTLEKHNIDTSHFTGKGHLKGKRNTWHHFTPLKDILNGKIVYKGGTYKLKNKLIKECVLEERCSNCKNTMWLDKKIPLELEHVNGKNDDNSLDNLKLLCPNCHALTNTYRGKNIGKNKKSLIAGMGKLADPTDLKSVC